jgi:DNA-binding response OmpR family regulator
MGGATGHQLFGHQVFGHQVAGHQVLIALDDRHTRDLLRTTLDFAGYQVSTVANASAALRLPGGPRFDVLICDDRTACLGDLSPRPPTLVLAECDALSVVVPRLRDGTDDYVTEPFHLADVLARLRRMLVDTGTSRTVRYGDLVLDDGLCQARRGDRRLHLTPGEYRLLRYLVRNADQVLSKDQIADHVGGAAPSGPAVEKLLSRLRAKVDGTGPALIHTRRGFGYVLGTA